jgi:nascent polypeptide-associated complex subunit alpha
MNPKQMDAMMRKMGITTETVKATEVIIVKPDGNIHIKDPNISIMTVQGERTWQITGREVAGAKDEKLPMKGVKAPEAKVKPKEATPEKSHEERPRAGPVYAEQDVTLVMDQTGCSEKEARKALEAADGQPAEAILHIMSKR